MTDKAEFVVVPREPTDMQLAAAHDAPLHGHPETASQKYSEIYQAMLAAAPKFEAGDAVQIAREAEDKYMAENPSNPSWDAMRTAKAKAMIQAAFPALVARCQELESELGALQSLVKDREWLLSMAEVERLKGAK